MGRIAFESKVAVGVSGKGVSAVGALGVGVSLSDKGWKGVRVGVAFAGAVTRNNVAGAAAVELTGGAAQPAKKKMISSVVGSVLFMKFLQLVCVISG